MSIKNQISNWNGFRIHGDTSELDKNLEDDEYLKLFVLYGEVFEVAPGTI